MADDSVRPAAGERPHLKYMLGPGVLCLVANHAFFALDGEARLELLGAGIFCSYPQSHTASTRTSWK